MQSDAQLDSLDLMIPLHYAESAKAFLQPAMNANPQVSVSLNCEPLVIGSYRFDKDRACCMLHFTCPPSGAQSLLDFLEPSLKAFLQQYVVIPTRPSREQHKRQPMKQITPLSPYEALRKLHDLGYKIETGDDYNDSLLGLIVELVKEVEELKEQPKTIIYDNEAKRFK